MLQRTFIPGSEWLYFKIYTGTNTADNILRTEIASIVDTLKQRNLIDKWFFIRYSDPNFHLRIRIHFKELNRIGEALVLFQNYLKPVVNDYLISNIQMDTYNREIERYDASFINDSETLFYYDSECTLKLIKQFSELRNENYRWQIALVMIDSLLSDFLYTTEHKFNLLNDLSLSFKKEFGFNEFNSKQFNYKYRENKSIIESILGRKENSTISNLIDILDEKSSANKVVVTAILDKINTSSKSLDDLLSSYIHMMLNRLFRSRNRTHELILYDFMKRYYESSIAKSKYSKKTQIL